jgi:hypothetical protein
MYLPDTITLYAISQKVNNDQIAIRASGFTFRLCGEFFLQTMLFLGGILMMKKVNADAPAMPTAPLQNG